MGHWHVSFIRVLWTALLARFRWLEDYWPGSNLSIRTRTYVRQTLITKCILGNTDPSCSPVECTESPLGLTANTRYELTYHSAVHTSGSNQNDGIVQEINANVAVQTGANACQLQLEVTDVDSLSNVETALRPVFKIKLSDLTRGPCNRHDFENHLSDFLWKME